MEGWAVLLDCDGPFVVLYQHDSLLTFSVCVCSRDACLRIYVNTWTGDSSPVKGEKKEWVFSSLSSERQSSRSERR